MELLVIISQALLYLCFSVLAGSFLLLLVPGDFRPALRIPKRLLLASAIVLPIAAFVPVLDIILFIAPRIGLVESIQSVLTTYTAGTSWDFTLLGSIILVLLIAFAYSEKTSFAFIGTLLTFGLILPIAWSSHAGSLDPAIGIISDFIHLAAVSIWVGMLVIIGWFSVNHENWLKFLSWFSIVAFSCLGATILSGLFMMDVIVENYIVSWMTSYGQGLLVKHLFMLPLLFYALVNGIIMKFKLAKNPLFNPKPWIRLESFILFAIFTITAVYSQQPPPHGNYLTSESISPLFRLFNDGIINADSTIGFVVNSNTVIFFFLSILAFGLMVLSFFKKAPVILSFLFSCFFAASIFTMIMVTTIVR